MIKTRVSPFIGFPLRNAPPPRIPVKSYTVNLQLIHFPANNLVLFREQRSYLLQKFMIPTKYNSIPPQESKLQLLD